MDGTQMTDFTILIAKAERESVDTDLINLMKQEYDN